MDETRLLTAIIEQFELIQERLDARFDELAESFDFLIASLGRRPRRGNSS